MRALCALICLCLLLSSAAANAESPVGDRSAPIERQALLTLPLQSGGGLGTYALRLSFPVGKPEAETLLAAFFSFAGNDLFRKPGSATVGLSSAHPIELSDGVLTVNLSSGALALPKDELFTLCRCIANTVTESGDVQTVQFLSEGIPLSLDMRGLFPLGAFSRVAGVAPQSEYALLENQFVLPAEDAQTRPMERLTTLYVPAKASRGILPIVRNVNYPNQEPAQVLSQLLKEFVRSSQNNKRYAALPTLNDYLAQSPALIPMSGGGYRAVFTFTHALNTALADAGVTRSVFLAGLCYTVCTFYPSARGIDVTIGQTHIDGVTPSGVFEGEAHIAFQGFLQPRRAYQPFLMQTARLFFASPDLTTLQPVERPVPWKTAEQPRALLLEWLRGVLPYDSDVAKALLPPGLGDSDILGTALDGDTLHIHLSARAADFIRVLSPQNERFMCFALVNTLCTLPGVDAAAFSFAGDSQDTLAGGVCWVGSFWRNTHFSK